MELHQLRYALAVVDHGTFTAAAEACFVAQPSLSHAIRTLERELGVELFARIGRRTALTAAGEAFVPPAREALRAARHAAGRRRCRRRGGRRPPRPGRPPHPRRRTGHPAGGRVPGPAPGRHHPPRASRGHRRAGRARPLRRERARDHRAAGDGAAHHDDAPRPAGAGGHPPADARPADAPRPQPRSPRRPIVTQRRGTSTRDALDAALATVGATATIAVETDQREAIVPLVLAGAGVAVVPRPMAAVAAAAGRGRRLAPARAAPPARPDPPRRAAVTGRPRLHRPGSVPLTRRPPTAAVGRPGTQCRWMEPSSASTQYGLWATSQGCPSGSRKRPE